MSGLDSVNFVVVCFSVVVVVASEDSFSVVATELLATAGTVVEISTEVLVIAADDVEHPTKIIIRQLVLMTEVYFMHVW